MAKVPSLKDRHVKMRAWLNDAVFGYDHWNAKQFCAPPDAKPALLLVFDDERERDAVLKELETQATGREA